MRRFYQIPGKGQQVIPYRTLKLSLFVDDQLLVPFLGAGASFSEASRTEVPPLNEPDQATIDSILTPLRLSDTARDFLAAAVRVAYQIQQVQAASPQEDPFEAVRRNKWPPSAVELAAALAHVADFDCFASPAEWLGSHLPGGGSTELKEVLRRAAAVTGLASPAPSLLSVASYYSYAFGAENLWLRLKTLFENKGEPPRVHRMVACVAWYYLSRQRPKDYLIITTNYDRLVELALKKANVPYCVLVVDKDKERVEATFSDGFQEYLKRNDEDFKEFREGIQKHPTNCYPGSHPPIVIVYKIHGCLYPPRNDCRSVILTDDDYVEYMRKNGLGNSQIPVWVKLLIERKGFLFMGYSFSDWNVRGWYTSLVGDPNMRTKHLQDYAVMKDLSPYEDHFFDEKDIDILHADLTSFGNSIMSEAPTEAKTCGAWQ